MTDIKLNTKEMRELEKVVLKRIEDIIFRERKRPSRQEKIDGGLVIEDRSGDLRRKLKANRGFIKQTGRGFVIDVKMMSYYKFLDDERRDDLNWYLSEAIFEDDRIKAKIKEVMGDAFKRTILKVIGEEK